MAKELWYKEWFDTEYYHLLYNNRNDKEAADFIRAISDYLNLEAGISVADIACGKGRHTRVLAELGFMAHGYDLSEKNIAFAKAQKTAGTKYFVHDMRKAFDKNNFSVAFNLFTSFGYFDSALEDFESVANIFDMIEARGFFVQDYINAFPFIKNMPASGQETRGDVVFDYQKNYDGVFIHKSIDVSDRGEVHRFEEKIKVYTQEKLCDIHNRAGFEVVEVFGDYNLSAFDAAKSPRIVVVSKKPDV
jgi:SAM-dependent methyltransferase